MSKGIGRIERAILAVFASEPDNAFTVDELINRICPEVFPGIKYIERKHTVSVLRAVKNLIKRGYTLDTCQVWGQGSPLLVYNFTNVISYGMARLRDMSFTLHRDTVAERRARLAEGGDHHHLVVEGGSWWEHTQWAIEEHEAKRTGDTARLERLKVREQEFNDRVIGKLAEGQGKINNK
jgi:hypothetical protein